jgi:hypothetical protein
MADWESQNVQCWTRATDGSAKSAGFLLAVDERFFNATGEHLYTTTANMNEGYGSIELLRRNIESMTTWINESAGAENQ